MRMWRHEWRLIWADRGVRATLVAAIIAVGYASVNGVLWQRDHAVGETLQRASQEHIDQMARQVVGSTFVPGLGIPRTPQQTASVAGNLAIGGSTVSLPRWPLGALAIGRTDVEPTYTSVSLWKEKQDLFSEPGMVDPVQLWTGWFDPAFVVVYLWPLLLLLVTYDAVSGEIDGGTLGLLRAQPQAAGLTLVRRALVRTIALGLPVWGMPLLACASSTMRSGSSPWVLAAGAAMWTLAFVLYTGFWLFMLLAIGANPRRSSSANGLAATGIWIACCIALPQLLMLTVSIAQPAPARVEYVQTLREAQTRAERPFPILLREYYAVHPEIMPAPGQRGIPSPAYLQQWAIGRDMASVLARFEMSAEDQADLGRWLMLVSPSSTMAEVLNVIAGADAARLRRFRREVTDFHSEWAQFFARRVFLNLPMTPELYAQVPRFRLVETPGGWLGRLLWPLIGLTLFAAAAMFGCRAALSRHRLA